MTIEKNRQDNEALDTLRQSIETRVNSIRAAQENWPCERGCDGCCHRLAEIPELTAPEWQRLKTALDALPTGQQQHIQQGIAALETAVKPLTCPFLDQASGACPVYAERPIACRTYGFYIERDTGLYCSHIQREVDKGEAGSMHHVIWGNQQAVDAQLATLGPKRPLTDWLRDDPVKQSD